MNADVDLPPGLRRSAAGSAAGRDWLRGFNDLYAGIMRDWNLQATPGGPWFGQTAAVFPVLAPDGAAAVLKLTVPHPEAAGEARALALWDGRGAVRLLADRGPFVLLLERLDAGRPLSAVPLGDTVGIWGGLMRQLQPSPAPASALAPAPAPAPAGSFDQVSALAEEWTDTLPARWLELGKPFPTWLLECALEVCQVRGSVGRREDRDVLLHSDLHYGNILARLDFPDRFAAIDPKPLIGEPEFAVAPMLWNRIAELSTADAGRHLHRRCVELAEAAGLDPETAREWAVAREVDNALDYLQTRSASDALRSLWVASTLAGRTLPDLPPAHALPVPA
ncbi:aminoglycoside phosphotransferase family protein [Arthrobacter sulfonylureivorans]|uniref:aminoglycoside phosphotransferase family protein n=1 Tax=Arthrobacter sulfonylureivorans TaxID=2486855 RepID=UPI0039E60464